MSINSIVASAPATSAEIKRVFDLQMKNQWAVGRTTVKERIAKLQRLHDCVLAYRTAIEEAVWKDFRKSPTEADISEIGVIVTEIRHTIKHLRSWMTPKTVDTPLTLFGSSSYIVYEPKGVCLLISPWNFPFNLTLGPLIQAIAAGNCVIIKPSEFTMHSSALMKKMIAELFSEDEVALFEGDASTSEMLLALPFHHIFFTGSPAVGKIVMAAAAKNLTSVTLELGGKSPVIVDESADLKVAAAKIAWINCLNAGQICIEPDYVLVHESKKAELVRLLGEHFEKFYGKTAQDRQQSPDLCRIVNDRHFQRVKGLMDDAVAKGAKVIYGGHTDAKDRYIEPTLLENVPANAKINEEEIFGPILPIYTFKTREEAANYINADQKPLAVYIFCTKNSQTNWYIAETRAGGVSVNDCAIHFYNPNLPFGGVNNSGIGKSHGEFGFLEFSNPKGVMKQTKFMPTSDLMLPPYGSKLGKIIIELIMKWF